MPNESFMLISLEEEKAKRLAQVISNETCTKILNHLANGKDGTETEIAKLLSLPLSTVHYNLKLLLDAKLVLADEYHYSEKGREVKHFKLANRYIIIAPQEERETFLKKLKGLLPALGFTVALALIIRLVAAFFTTQASARATELSMQTFGAEAPSAAGPMLAAAPPAPVSPTLAPSFAFSPNEALLFFIAGAVFITLLFAISAYVHRKR